MGPIKGEKRREGSVCVCVDGVEVGVLGRG